MDNKDTSAFLIAPPENVTITHNVRDPRPQPPRLQDALVAPPDNVTVTDGVPVQRPRR
jgi:hypothetical protein